MTRPERAVAELPDNEFAVLTAPVMPVIPLPQVTAPALVTSALSHTGLTTT